MPPQLQLAPVSLNTRANSKSSGVGSLCEKKLLILNDVKISLLLICYIEFTEF